MEQMSLTANFNPNTKFDKTSDLNRYKVSYINSIKLTVELYILTKWEGPTQQSHRCLKIS